MKNLPDNTVKEPIGICSSPAPGVLRIYNNDGYRITEINYNPDYPEGLARSIATAIIEARDFGYKQCQAHMRTQLGLK